MFRYPLLSLALGAVLALGTTGAQAQDEFIVVQSTTSTLNSGLFEHILPARFPVLALTSHFYTAPGPEAAREAADRSSSQSSN